MQDGLVIKAGICIPSWELVFTASRSGGPGGQHANKTSSRITLHWSLRDTTALGPVRKKRVLARLRSRLTADGVLQLHVEESRSQHRNKEIAHDRLRELLIEALKVPKHRVATRPTKGSKRRRVDTKKARGSVKQMRRKPSEDH